LRFYFDITLSRQHRGTPHGLARVEVSLAREFIVSDVDVTPIWLNENWEVCIGDERDVSAISDGSHSKTAAFENYSTEKKNACESTQFGLKSQIVRLKEVRIGNRIITICTYVISLFPSRLIPFLLPCAKQGYILAAKTVASFRKVRKSSSSKWNSVESRTLTVSSDDLVIIAGNDWDRRIYEKVRSSEFDRAQFAVVIYDLIPYDYVHYSVDIETASRFTYWVGDVAQTASHIFFISKYSQERFNFMLKNRCIESKAKQMVINLPPGVLPSPEIAQPNFHHEIEKDFVLVVCTIESRKNHQILLNAARLASSRNESFPQLIFIGSPGWGTEQLVQEIKEDETLQNRIIIKSGISDSELRWLYEKCTTVAYPSIVEGFGLPVFEAAVFKKPIVTSDIPVFDEIPHPLRTKVNPYDTEGWKNALQNAASKTEPPGGWKELHLPTWKENIQQMIAFMS
jgi:glycosyltransferase involved in cell wall biosynthesis